WCWRRPRIRRSSEASAKPSGLFGSLSEGIRLGRTQRGNNPRTEPSSDGCRRVTPRTSARAIDSKPASSDQVLIGSDDLPSDVPAARMWPGDDNE
ncbi:MAG: hypothetical protein WCP55_11610, partial [Lentisphaerota bacterium]